MALPGLAATFGTVTTVVGSVSDIVLDENRRRLYLVNANANRVEIFSLPPNPIRQVATIPTDALPLSAALSPDQRYLYVVCHTASALNIIDLEQMRVVARPNVPARPEGIAVGNDGRPLITTIGTGVGNSQNTLLVYDPDRAAFDNVVVVPAAPALPPGAPPAGRAFLSNRSQLRATDDGALIIGVNIPNNNNRVVFVYEVASGTILRSRVINNISSVLAISPDGKKFMSGLNLFETETLEVLAQQNLANAPYPIQPNTNFNTQQNQGGSVFTPDGQTIYSAFNIAPVQVPVSRPNVAQLMVNDPDNLLIHRAYQMPENLAGKMVITSDGSTIYAISESGFTAIPVGNAERSPILELSQTVVQLASDQCGVNEGQQRLQVQGINMGSGRVTATAQVLQLTATGPGGLGGAGGPGGGAPGGGVVIVLPPVGGGGAANPGGVAVPGGTARPTNNAIFQTAPAIRTQNTASGPVFDLTFNNLNARSLGTIAPHDFLVQSNEAINIPPRLRVFQNFRNAEAAADVRPVPIGISANEGIIDIVFDSTRRRIYMANSGLNRVEVFDTRNKEFEQPIKVGQLPRSLAISPDGNTLYVANSGSESITMIDLNERQVIGKLRFPPLPFNATAALLTPSVIAATQRGLLVVMNNGSMWKAVGNDLLPRPVSPIIGAATVQQPRTVASTPNGEYAILLAGNGFVYLYDSSSDEFVAGRQVFTNPIQGYYGPVAAGPNGRYFLVNGTVLNPALTPIGSAGTVVAQGGGGQQTTTLRPIAAVAPLSLNQYVRFAQPTLTNATQLLNTTPTVEVADATTGNTVRALPAVEGPISTQVGTQRVNVNGRQIAVDTADNTAYLITTSGLTIVPLTAPAAADRPVFNAAGVTNSANGKTSLAPGSLITINGRGLGADATAEPPFPTRLGGVCATLNNRPIPLTATATGQIRAQIPPDFAAGRFPLVVRNFERNVASAAPVQITLAKYAPAVVVDPETKQTAIYDSEGRPVNRQNPTTRDRRLTLFAVGLGATKAQVPAGQPAPEDTPAITDPVSVFFGDPRYREAAIVVEWSGLAPGLVGVYRVDLYVPGDRIRGEDLPVTVRIGGISSPTGGEMDPKVTVR